MHRIIAAVVLLVLVAGQTRTVSAQADALEEGRVAIGAGDYAKALRVLTPLAKKGHPVAQNGLGVLYLNGWGVKQDFQGALQWFRKAAEQEEPRAQFNLGRMYDQGRGLSKDYEEAVKWYRKSADQGYPPGQSLLAGMYAQGDGVPQDYAEAMKWYRRAAENGDAVAQARIGFMYVEGQGVPKDYVEAEKWFRQAAAQEHPLGYYWLGRLYFEGWGVKKDLREAIRWLEMPAARDSAEAQYSLGLIYANGGEDVKRDDVKAILWFRRAAAQGDKESVKLLRERYKTSAEEGPTLVAVEQALQAPPQALAESYLAVSYLLGFLRPARDGQFGATIETTIDGKPQTINEANALIYRAGYEDRLRIYSLAIEQRGFQKLGGAYDTKVTAGCQKLGFSSGESVISQEGSEVKMANGEFRGELRHRGVVVGDALAIELAMNPEIILTGRSGGGQISIKHEPSHCMVTLRAKQAAGWIRQSGAHDGDSASGVFANASGVYVARQHVRCVTRPSQNQPQRRLHAQLLMTNATSGDDPRDPGVPRPAFSGPTDRRCFGGAGRSGTANRLSG